MEIVQLSDIHVGSQFREEVFQKVIDEINEMEIKPVQFEYCIPLRHEA